MKCERNGWVRKENKVEGDIKLKKCKVENILLKMKGRIELKSVGLTNEEKEILLKAVRMGIRRIQYKRKK